MNKQQLRIVQMRLRGTHERLLELQGAMITSLHEVLKSITETHEEMITLYQADNDLDDLIENDEE